MSPASMEIIAWRHPKPQGAAGRCIGRTDLPVDHRKARRLAHRIRQAARRHGWPHVVCTSPLQRCAMVGRELRRWGWRHVIDASLLEMDFGAWDGQPWTAIPHEEVDRWCADFRHGRPGPPDGQGASGEPGEPGESLQAMFDRVEAGLAASAAKTSTRPGNMPMLVVAHGGWMQIARWLSAGLPPPSDPASWPSPPAYGECLRMVLAQSVLRSVGVHAGLNTAR
ncbi:MAG: histidine phosphatase family protein [Aquabacterium sp.]